MGLVFVVARLLRIRVVLECNGVAWEEFRSRGYPRWYCSFVRLMAWQQAVTCSAIIGVTPAIRDAYCQLGGKSSGYAISNGVFTEKIPIGARDSIRKEHQWHEDDTVFIMPSEFAPWHATRLLVEAVGSLSTDDRKGMRFVLPGSGEEFSDIRQLVDQMKLNSVIDLPGRLERQKIYQLLSAADVGLFLIADAGKLRYPGSPLKLFEYLGAGLETIVSADSYHSQLIPYYELGSVIEAATPSHIAAALRHHSLNRVSETRRRQIRRVAESEFHWRKVAHRVLAVLAGHAPELEQWQQSHEPRNSRLVGV
jgi:glycosyltransferase involved in cell wall biosynthesis